jgi:FAD/FMN-containing dehydrogenase
VRLRLPQVKRRPRARSVGCGRILGHRHDQWDCVILSQWDSPADDAKNIRWTREFHAAMRPHLERGVYVNDLGADEPERVRAAYGENYERLAAVKARYDPENFFRANQNVATAA